MIEPTLEIKGHFLRLYQIALADGEFSTEELKMLYTFAEERGIKPQQLDKILLGSIGKLEIPSKIETRLEYLYDFSRMIWADGKVSPDERAIMEKYARRFGFIEENIESLCNSLLDSVEAGKSKSEILKEAFS